MTFPTLKLDLTTAELDMAFVLFQTARQDKYTFDDINTLMRKIQEQGKPQLEALAIQRDTAAVVAKAKERKPKAPKAALVVETQQPETTADVSIPDLSDLKLD